MGSGSSRMGSARAPRHRPDGRARLGLASFLCGGASSSSAAASEVSPPKMEDRQSEKLVIPARLRGTILADNLQDLSRESPANFSSENNSSSSANEHMTSNLNSDAGLKQNLTEFRNAETSGKGKCFSESKELVPCLENASSGLNKIHSVSSCDLASTSKSQHQEPLLTNVNSTLAPIREADDSTNDSSSHNLPLGFSNCTSQLETPDLPVNDTTVSENPSNEVVDIHGSGLSPASAVSNSSSIWHLLGEESIHNGTPAAAAFITSGRSGEQTNGTNGSVLHVDVVSISSNILPTGTGETSSNETRRNSRRLFWDAFSRRSTRRNYESSAIFTSAENTNDLGSHDRWLLDISDDLFGSRFDYDSVYLRRRNHGSNGRRWHSRSEIRERLRGGFDDDSRQSTFCPTGLHPEGTCSCDSLFMAEESSTRASISRIVMLAEALFEVLDEIHRQPVSLSLSMVSLPAPESVVNSLPVKSYRKLDASSGGVDDVEQCYICLAEYEEGDKLRVLPCCHEYHMSCVDKWLKEIHGVCPLCRGDVCEGTAEGSSNM